MSWHLNPYLAFDTETTGVDVETERIVSAAAIRMHDGAADDTTWLADPGIEIPAGAFEIHGISTEQARAEGCPAPDVIAELVAALSAAVGSGLPLVGHNIVFDLTILDREARRHLGTDLITGLGAQPIVIDTMVLDRYCAPFRKRISEKRGPYQLRTTAETYGLTWDDDQAHGAKYDALMAGRVAWHIGHIAHQHRTERPEWVQQLRTKRFDVLRHMDLAHLHTWQVTWARLDAESYQRWLRDPVKAKEKFDKDAVVDGTWPLRPLPAAKPEAAEEVAAP